MMMAFCNIDDSTQAAAAATAVSQQYNSYHGDYTMIIPACSGDITVRNLRKAYEMPRYKLAEIQAILFLKGKSK